jgi:Isocitrate lyase
VTRFQSTIRQGGRVRWTDPDLCPATELADLGYTLQFSIQFNFNRAGLALEKGLQKFKAKGLEALADLQIEEDAAAGGYPDTKMHQKFAGMNRWLILESVLSQRT